MIRALIVDDKDDNLYYLQVVLGGDDYAVETAYHGADALAKARVCPPDIVISDLLMPVMDGFTLLQQWRADDRLRKVPFVVYTATYTDADDERLAESLGADAFILKPIEPEDLLARLREILGRGNVGVPHRDSPESDEQTILKLYNESIIRKLEQKTLQLEEANRALQQDIAERRAMEEKLKESNDKFHQLADNITDVFWIRSPDMREVHYVSPAFERLWGRKTEDLYRSPHQWTDFVMREDREAVSALFDSLTKDTPSISCEYRIERPDGEVRWVHARGFQVRDAAGKLIRLTGIVSDITDRRRAVDTMRELTLKTEQRERMLSTALSSMSDFSQIYDREGRFLFANQPLLDLWGLTLEDVVGKDFFDLGYPPQLAQRLLNQVQWVFENNQRVTDEATYTSPTGVEGHYEYIFSPILELDGKVGFVVGSTRDITERKRSEAALQASELRYHSLFENMLEGYAYCRTIFENGHLRDFVYLEVNSCLEELLGLTEVIGKKISEVIPGVYEANQGLFEFFGRVALTGNPEKCETNFEPLGIWLSVAAYSLEPGHFVAVFDNITERKRAEAALRQSHVQQSELARHLAQEKAWLVDAQRVAKVGSWETDLVSGELTWSDETFRIFEVDPSSYRPTHQGFLQLVHPNDRARVEGKFSQSFTEGSASRLEHRLLMPDGSVKTVEERWRVSSDDNGHPICAFGTCQDITDRKRIEVALQKANDELELRVMERTAELNEANESLRIENVERLMTMGTLKAVAQSLEKAKEEADNANRAKSDFLSRMSHELRTPMNAILGYGQLLEMRDLPEIQEDTEAILKAGQHLLVLINEVLDITRIEAGHLSLSPEPVLVSSVSGVTLDLVRPLTVQRKIRLSNESGSNHAGRYVFADQQRLRQVLVNLLSNAIKYNRLNGEVVLSTSVVAGELTKWGEIECEGKMRFSVRDTGPGISPENIAKLFTPFERLGAERTRVEGTGIGLSLCKRLVHAMHGDIGVQSTLGEGSTFWVDLPLVSAPWNDLSEFEDNTMLPQVELIEQALTILYIEDNISNFSVIERAFELQGRGINLLAAEQGSVGLDLARTHHPDLILLDLHLPDIMGDVVLGRLQSDPATRGIPVIILSADATAGQIERLLASGAKAYLTKPLNLKEFFNVVNQTLEERQQ